MRIAAVVLISLGVAFGAGWMMGGSGRSLLEQDRARFEMKGDFAESRALILDGRLSLTQSNFGDAIERFQNARNLIGRIQVRLRELGQVDQAGRLEIALTHLSEAQHYAAAFDSHAQGAASQATDALMAASGH